MRFGTLLANGIRSAADLEYAALSAARKFEESGASSRGPPTTAMAQIPALVFTTIAYNQPFFDGNKRTGFLSALAVAAILGFEFRAMTYWGLEEEIRTFSAKNAAPEEVARWLLQKVIKVPRRRR